MYDLIDAIYSMSLDVYRQMDSQDENTGAIKKEWAYYKTIPCHAKGVVTNSGTTKPSDAQSIGNRYLNEQMVEIRTHEKLTLREKVSNICDSSGNVIWEELNYPSNTPTVFEVVGTTPLTDPFGSVLAFNSKLKRSENQVIGF